MTRTGNTTKKLSLLAVGGWLALTLSSVAPASIGPAGGLAVAPTSGVPGTTVTVTGGDCGTPTGGLRAGLPVGNVGLYIPGSGQLRIFVSPWPEPFATTGILGTSNDSAGMVSATFVVPEVLTGPYTVSGTCETTCPVVRAGDENVCATPNSTSGSIRASAIGPYTGTTFTVTAPAAPAVTPTAVVSAPTTTG